MGYIAHDAVIVTTWDSPTFPPPDIEAFRASLPEEFRALVVGPVESPVNGYFSYLFLPDGSKEGWDSSDLGDQLREQFKALFRYCHEEGSSPHDMVHLRYGGDHASEVGTEIVEVYPKHEAPPTEIEIAVIELLAGLEAWILTNEDFTATQVELLELRQVAKAVERRFPGEVDKARAEREALHGTG